MPVVTVQMYEGRTVEQKRALVEAITRAMVDIAKTRSDAVNVIIQDVPRTNWGLDGKLASES
jgi:4-oxalocrotonate tautomerase